MIWGKFMSKGIILSRERQRERRKIKYPNKVPCTKIDYMARFPELTEKIMMKILKEL